VGDPRSVEDIYNAEIKASRSIPYESKARTELFARDRQTILDTANTLTGYKNDLSKLDPVKDKKKYDNMKNIYDKTLSTFNRDY
jgi:ATP-dependent helicase/DNAse subunit B